MLVEWTVEKQTKSVESGMVCRTEGGLRGMEVHDCGEVELVESSTGQV